MVLVTFKNSNSELSCIFKKQYPSVNEAKKAIVVDAKAFAKFHKVSKNSFTKKCKQNSRWVDPNCLDYYRVIAQDGTSCIWQYWIIKD